MKTKLITYLLVTLVTTLLPFNLQAKELLNNVVIISIDALHPDAVTRENAPNIFNTAKGGIIKLNGKSTNPPKTLVSHSAMFTGLRPEDGGRKSNAWHKGDPTVEGRTIFHLAKDMGYHTGYIYSKGKLAYLVNEAEDDTAFSKEYPIDKTVEYVNMQNKNFMFLHISGLDNTGPEYGWMSKEYIEDFQFIDEELKPLLDKVQQTGKYLLVITSDHAGHEKLHGCDHPDDYKLPFIAVSDSINVKSEVAEHYETYRLIDYLKSVGVF